MSNFPKQIPNEMLQNWIVDDLQDIFSKFSDDRYSIFEEIDKLDQIADNIKTLKKQGVKR